MQNQSTHIPRIDVLRAGAILVVFSFHFYSAVFGSLAYTWNGPWYHWVDSPSLLGIASRLTMLNGTLGVYLFFVISGLCIRLSQLSTSNFSLWHFYWRRFWRIYPPYLLALLICIAVQHTSDLRDIIAHLFLIHNFTLPYFISINTPFWSLALEFQVYLMYPLLLLMHERLGRNATAAILFALSVGSNIVGGETFRRVLQLPASFEIARQMPTLLWFTWYTGFLLADVIVARRHPTPASRIVLVAGIILVPVVRLYHPMAIFAPVVSGVTLALLVWEYLCSKPRLVPLSRGLAWLGICSYSFYLYFDQLIRPALNFLTATLHIPTRQSLFLIGYPVTLLFIFAISYAAYFFVEKGSILIGRALYIRIPAASHSRSEIRRENPQS